MQKGLRLPNSMQPIYYSTLIRPEWRTGKALCFHSFSITKSRFGYMINYNLLTNRPLITRRQTTGSQLALANSTVPTYKDYEALLKSAASTYDWAHTSAKRQPTRSAERTDIWDANITESFHEAYEFDLIFTLLLTLCKHICMTNQGWFPRKCSVDYRMSPRKPGPSYPMMFGWIFFGLYRQMAANVPKNLLACHLYVTNQGTTKHGYLRMLHSTGLYSSILRTMMPLLHLLSRRPCMTPLQPVPLHQPIQT
jgi:hypothetical protein